MLMMSDLQLYPSLCLNFSLTDEMKEPDDQDTDGGKSDRSKDDGKQSQWSSKSASRCK